MPPAFLWWHLNMSKVGIIGGTDFCELKHLRVDHREHKTTPYGLPSAPLTHGMVRRKSVVFLARHGDDYTIPAHKINYRANIHGLYESKVNCIIAVSVVAGIRSDMMPGHFVVPEQLIDYTYGREDTFYDGDQSEVRHINFCYPFDRDMRQALLESINGLELNVSDDAVYGVVQGPRMQTIAEIDRLERDGCDVVGMSLMPEAALAMELGIKYASLNIVAGKASGRDSSVAMAEIGEVYKEAHGKVVRILDAFLELI